MIANSLNLIGRVEGAININSDIYGVIWVLQVELYTSTAQRDGSGIHFSGGSSDVGRDCIRGKSNSQDVN